MGGGIGFPSGWEPVNPSGRPSFRCVTRREESAPGLQSTTCESGAGALRLDAGERAARLREFPSGGQRANVLAHRCCVPRRRYVRLRWVGALRCGGGGFVTAVALEMDPGTSTFITLPVVPVPEMPSQE